MTNIVAMRPRSARPATHAVAYADISPGDSIDVNLLLQQALEWSWYNLESNKVNIALSFDLNAPRVSSDSAKLRTLFATMMENLDLSAALSCGNGKLTIVTRGTDAGIRISIATTFPTAPSHVCSAGGINVWKYKNAITAWGVEYGATTWLPGRTSATSSCSAMPTRGRRTRSSPGPFSEPPPLASLGRSL